MGFLVALVVGLVFGGVDQYLGSLRPSLALGAWATSVSLMSAPWLALPFLFGLTQRRPRGAVLVGLTVTLAALGGYFVMTLSPVEGVSLAHVDAARFIASQRLNIAGGLLTGPLFGWLGWRWRVSRSWLAAGAIASAFCLEPLVRLLGDQLPAPLANAAALTGPAAVWIGEAALGIVMAGVLLARRWPDVGPQRAR